MDLFFDSLHMQGINNYIKTLFLTSRVQSMTMEHVRVLTGSGFKTKTFLVSISSNEDHTFDNVIENFLKAIHHVKTHGQKYFKSEEFSYIDLDLVVPFSDLETKLFTIAPTPSDSLDVSQMSINDASSYLSEIISDFYSNKTDSVKDNTIYQALRYAFVRRVTTTIEGRLNK